MSAIIFNGKDAKLLTGRDLLGSDGSVYGKGNEKSYTAGAARATYWGTSGAGITIVDDSTAAELPRPTTTATGLKITGVSGSTAYAYYRFVLDDADANTKLKVQFALKPVSGYATNDFQVSVYSNTASDYTTGNTRLALSTDVSAVTGIPNLTGTFRTTFDAPAVTAKWIEVRIGLNGTNTHACVFSDLIVGPGVVTQGAAISQFQTFTPTLSGIGTATFTTSTWYYKQVGDTYEIQGYLNVNVAGSGASLITATLPNGYSINTAALAQGSVVDRGSLGYGQFKISGTGNNMLMPVYDSTTTIAFFEQSANPGTLLTGASLTAGSELWVTARIPISQLAGSGTVNVAINDVEYQSNSSTSSSNDTASFAAGQAGQLVPTLTASAVATSVAKRVRFSSPIQASDTLVLEFQDAGTGNWTPIAANGSYMPFQIQGTVRYGVAMANVNGTDVDVFFYQGGRVSSGGSWGAAGANYPSNPADRWRVKKFSGGQAVGFGICQPGISAGLISASGVPGNAGNAIASGYVGENLQAVNTAGASSPASADIWTDADTTSLSLTLTKGVWLVGYGITASSDAAGGGGSLRLNLSTDGAVNGTTAYVQPTTSGASTYGYSRQAIINTATASQTLRVQYRRASSGTCVIASQALTAGMTDPDNQNIVWAVRIA